MIKEHKITISTVDNLGHHYSNYYLILIVVIIIVSIRRPYHKCSSIFILSTTIYGWLLISDIDK